MKVLFGVASTNYNADIHDRVRARIQRLGYAVYFEGQQTTLVESKGAGAGLDDEDWKVLCRRELDAARVCNAAIFDVTNRVMFGIGFMASICLARDVPALFLLNESSLGGSFITGLAHSALTRRYYNEGNVESVVTDLFKELK